jgi:tetratricopeptide (TPR) repeat protein
MRDTHGWDAAVTNPAPHGGGLATPGALDTLITSAGRVAVLPPPSRPQPFTFTTRPTMEPTTPQEALSLAEAAQTRCDHAEAERWGLRAARLAGEEDPLAAYLGRRIAGRARVERGDFREAVKQFQRAELVVSRAPELEERRPRIAHDLVAACVLAGMHGAAEEYYRRALRGYAPGDPRLPRLAGDRAWALLERGAFEEAAGVYAPLPAQVSDPEPRLSLHANFTVALAGAGRRSEALGALEELRELLEAPNVCGAAWGWVSVARALLLLGLDRPGARSAAAIARRLAASHGEEHTRQAAARLQATLAGA